MKSVFNFLSLIFDSVFRIPYSVSVSGFQILCFGASVTEIQEKSILVQVSARFELVRVWVIGSRLYNHAALCYSGTKLSRNQSLVNLLFSVLQDSILNSILDSLFSILDSLFEQESRIANGVEMDCQLTFERYCRVTRVTRVTWVNRVTWVSRVTWATRVIRVTWLIGATRVT